MINRIIAACFLMATFAACNNKVKNEVNKPISEPEMNASETISGKECYEYVNLKDTVTMSLAMNANNANGELMYNFYEKDKNKGTFSGTFIGDTLYCDYTFQSEGMTSIREAVFLKKGSALVQGFGEMIEKDNKQVFKNAKKLQFDSNVVLSKVDCE